MLKKLLAPVLLAAIVAVAVPAYAKTVATTSVVPLSGSSFISLCYHNVEDTNPDQAFDGTTTKRLVEQLAWLKHEGYQAVTIDQILAARAGKKALPEKSYLLTFDDGYESFYTRVYPILKAFNTPAVLAVVDSWLDDGKDKKGKKSSTMHHTGDSLNDQKVMYGSVLMPRSFFLTWKQIREMSKSGLVEIASHTDSLHLGILGNPQGNTEPSALTARFDPKSGTYETTAAFEKRIADDMAHSSAKITKETGKKPRVMVWPYGAYSGYGMAIANKHGMPITLTLDDGAASVNNLNAVPRQLVNHDPDIEEFAIHVRHMDANEPIRAVQIDLDYVYDANPDQMAHNIDLLINRIHDLQINRVFLQAFSNPEGDGLAKQVYFPNRSLPMRADLFNRIAWQLKTRCDVDVYGWLPVLSFDFGSNTQTVQTVDKDGSDAHTDAHAYHRVSPFDAAGRQKIIDLYEDMARMAPIDGILFHDDATLSDYEDANPEALAAYKKAGLPASIADIRANPATLQKWTAFKTTTLIDFTHDLEKHAEKFRAPLKTVRNIYAPVVLDPESETWFAQNYDKFLQAYDYTAIEAMPKLENIPDSDADAWMQRLVVAASSRPNGLKKTIFELQSVDWNKQEDRAIPAEDLAAQMRFLVRQGALNFGYYPDDFVTNTPDLSIIHKDFSLQSYPYQP